MENRNNRNLEIVVIILAVAVLFLGISLFATQSKLNTAVTKIAVLESDIGHMSADFNELYDYAHEQVGYLNEVDRGQTDKNRDYNMLIYDIQQDIHNLQLQTYDGDEETNAEGNSDITIDDLENEGDQ